ncbi:Bax protein [Modicisalibacter xianhensis]|uniref:Bax protein n=2 Tax=Modicisalibacter xianhensis TaxID=442341 RepID=A0A4R8FXQ6_9GAMM|nr:Bax protein [Halomonas xianhensis]
MRRCRPRRRLRVTAILAVTACLGVGVAPFPMTAQAESTWETRAETITQQALYRSDLDPVSELPDLRDYPAGPVRKQVFLKLLVPLVEAENARIAAQREWLETVQTRGGARSGKERQRLATLCQEYDLACRDQRITQALLDRVNTVPLSMVIIQAIEESGWGTSRFARQGNNLFGLRCFKDGCGLAQAGSGRQYSAFDTVRDAVRTYLHNLNTHEAYAQLRERRARLVAQQRPVTAEALIGALEGYATRHDYQDVLLSLLRTNNSLILSHRSDKAV